MNSSNLEASVKYGDLHGTSAADEIGPEGGLEDLAQDNGVDTDKYLIIGARLDIGENHPGRPGMVFLKLLAVDKNQTGDSVDQIRKFSMSSESVPYYEFSIKVELQDFIMQFKRFSVVLLLNPLVGIQNFELQETDEEE